MLPYVAAAIVGAVFMGKTKAKTVLKKVSCMGPRTGTLYVLEESPATGVIFVHCPDGSLGAFMKRVGPSPLVFLTAKGHPDSIATMKKDLLP